MTADDEKGYNGWTNYETWAMALWMDNDRASYLYARELVAAAVADKAEGRTDEGAAADALKDWIEEARPDLGASVWSDLLGAAFSEVDWYEIASGILEES